MQLEEERTAAKPPSEETSRHMMRVGLGGGGEGRGGGGNFAVDDDQAANLIMLTVRVGTAAWVQKHGLGPKIAAALDRMTSDDGTDAPLAFLAAHFAELARAEGPCAAHTTAAVRLQSATRGFLVRTKEAESDRRTRNILVAAHFLSLQTAFQKEEKNSSTHLSMAEDETVRMCESEDLEKEVTRIAAAHRAQRHHEMMVHSKQHSGPLAALCLGALQSPVRQNRKTLSAAGDETAAVTLSNPFADADFKISSSSRTYVSGDDPRWWKVGLHNHGPRGEEQLGFFPYTKVAQMLKDKGYRCVCIVEHEHFVKFTHDEAAQLEKAVAAGGPCEGLVILTGAEGRSHSAYGEHITCVNNHPDLLIATHPNTVMTDGMDQIDATKFMHDSSFQNVRFLEVGAELRFGSNGVSHEDNLPSPLRETVFVPLVYSPRDLQCLGSPLQAAAVLARHTEVGRDTLDRLPRIRRSRRRLDARLPRRRVQRERAARAARQGCSQPVRRLWLWLEPGLPRVRRSGHD